MTAQPQFDADGMKDKLRGQWINVISTLAPRLSGGMQILKKSQPCPRCGGSDRFNYDKDFNDNGAIWCRKCDLQCPDGIETLVRFNGWDFKYVLSELAKYLGEVPPMPMPKPAPDTDIKKTDWAKKVWSETIAPDSNLFISEYLKFRGLSGEVPATIRFHPSLYHKDQWGDEYYEPALVAKIQNLAGDIVGLQRIYLSDSGQGKSDHKPNKMILPGASGGLSGGCVMLAPSTQSYLCIAEGIETALAVAEMTKQPTWASVTSTLMPNMEIPANVTILWIYADKDEAGQKAAEALARNHPDKKCYICYPEGEGDWLDAYKDKGLEALTHLSGVKPYELPAEDDLYVLEDDTATSTPDTAISEQFNYKILTDKELDEGDFPITYLINGILVKGQPCVMGAPKKTMKTSVLIDLAYSLASGTPHLGNFKVNGKHRVGIMSAESGMGTLQETARRIRKSKNIDTQNVFWCSEVPYLDNEERVAALFRFVIAYKLAVIILDPAYMMMCGLGSGASNLFEVAKFLAVISKLCEETGVTPIIAHHSVKGSGGDFEPLELESLAFAGFQEWARQWILLSRRCRYDPDVPGSHRLWMVTGGSAGHAGQWGIDIEEGSIDDVFGRKWEVEIDSSGNIYKEREEHKQLVKENQATEKARKSLQEGSDKVLAYLTKCGGGDSKTQIADHTGMSRAKTAEVLAHLLEIGRVELKEMTKGNQNVKGYVVIHVPL